MQSVHSDWDQSDASISHDASYHCRNNVTLSAQEKDPRAIPTHIATWVTIVLPFTKVPYTNPGFCKCQVLSFHPHFPVLHACVNVLFDVMAG